jgi:hypothetical protein
MHGASVRRGADFVPLSVLLIGDNPMHLPMPRDMRALLGSVPRPLRFPYTHATGIDGLLT